MQIYQKINPKSLKRDVLGGLYKKHFIETVSKFYVCFVEFVGPHLVMLLWIFCGLCWCHLVTLLWFFCGLCWCHLVTLLWFFCGLCWCHLVMLLWFFCGLCWLCFYMLKPHPSWDDGALSVARPLLSLVLFYNSFPFSSLIGFTWQGRV